MKLSAKDIERFHRHVDRSGGPDACHLWKKSCFRDGYGKFAVKGVNKRAHRIAWIIAHGEIPEDKPCVLHNCPSGDNPACVNAAHLWVGTNEDNVADKVAKGRQSRGDHMRAALAGKAARGSAVGTSKLTEQSVVEIRSAYAAGSTQRELMDRYSIGKSMLYNVIYGVWWKHIPGALPRPKRGRRPKAK